MFNRKKSKNFIAHLEYATVSMSEEASKLKQFVIKDAVIKGSMNNFQNVPLPGIKVNFCQ